jgi:hypothetical protein
VDGGQDPSQAAQPAAGVRRPPVHPAGQPGHQHGRHPGLRPGRVDREKRGRGHARGFGDTKCPCLPRGDVWVFRVEFRPDVAAQHRLPPLPGAVGDGEQVYGRGHPAAQGPGRDHRAAQAGGGPGQRLPRRAGAQQPPGRLVVAEPVRG